VSRDFIELSIDEPVVDAADLPWLLDHGVRIDRKGRVVVSLPAPEVQLSLLAGGTDGDAVPIAELMRRDIDPKLTRARARRRRGAKIRTINNAGADGDASRSSRFGRPTIGTEVRVRVHTTIAQRTQQTLSTWRITFAQILDECACELADAS
jgi:hypothetical protein